MKAKELEQNKQWEIDNPHKKHNLLPSALANEKERITKLDSSHINPDYCTESPDTELAFINVLVENTFKSAKAKDFEQNKQWRHR